MTDPVFPQERKLQIDANIFYTTDLFSSLAVYGKVLSTLHLANFFVTKYFPNVLYNIIQTITGSFYIYFIKKNHIFYLNI